jgi:hypothetical protein
VREWAACTGGELGLREAVLMLRVAYQRQRAFGGGADWTEAVEIRRA